jgi:hypothetical protein
VLIIVHHVRKRRNRVRVSCPLDLGRQVSQFVVGNGCGRVESYEFMENLHSAAVSSQDALFEYVADKNLEELETRRTHIGVSLDQSLPNIFSSLSAADQK